MNNLSIKQKLLAAFLTIILLVLIDGTSAYYIEHRTSVLAENTIGLHNETIMLKSRLIDHIQWTNQLLESAASGNNFTGLTDPTKCEFGKWYYKFKSTNDYSTLDQKRKKLIDDMESYHSSLHASAVSINSAGSISRALEIYRLETKPNVAGLQELFNGYIGEIDTIMEKFESDLKKFQEIAVIIKIVIILFIMLASSVITIITIRDIMKSFRLFSSGFKKIAEGDLTTKIDSSGDDEFGRLAFSFNSFVKQVREVVNEILDMSAQLASSSEELASTSLSFSENAQSQAASSEEVTATIEEISAGMDGVAVGAQQQSGRLDSLVKIREELNLEVQKMQERINITLKLSENIAGRAMDGETSLKNMDGSIQKIGKSSGEVTNIVQIINEISEKINLLSLNAAIEAARAGDSGRGFAVVADEISKLADQTARSIKDIDSLIKANEVEIQSGLVNVKSTVDIITVIIHGVSEISTMMHSINDVMDEQIDINKRANNEMLQVKQRSDEIKHSSEEQKIATEEIAKSIADISHITQTTASGAEEMTANAEEIAGMADRLKARVDYFNV
ncbi:MAG TPA: methyl-accepting chemotaxis protein [Spirochaetota bacterium]|nr:methyl-accepting chemotaxis protein [Spirochaetota bacterium]